MTLKKFLLLVLAVFLLLLLDIAAIYGFFHQYVFNFPVDGDIAQLGEEYQSATLLHDKIENPQRYLLVEMENGETRLLAMQGSELHPDRYRYVPSSTQVIPDERPYTCTVYAGNITRIINIQGDWIRPLEGGTVGRAFMEELERALPYVLLMLELGIWGLAAHLVKKKRQAVPSEGNGSEMGEDPLITNGGALCKKA